MASTPGFEPGPHWWEASALTTTPPLLPLPVSLFCRGRDEGSPYSLRTADVFPVVASLPPLLIWILSICSSLFHFQGLKIDDRQTRWDYIHDENLRLGENKYSTLQKVSNEFVCHIYFWAFQLNDPSPSRIIKIRYLMLFFVFSFCFLLITSSLVVVHSQILPFCFQLVEHRPRINAAGGSN